MTHIGKKFRFMEISLLCISSGSFSLLAGLYEISGSFFDFFFKLSSVFLLLFRRASSAVSGL